MTPKDTEQLGIRAKHNERDKYRKAMSPTV